MREYEFSIAAGETSRRTVPPANFIRVKSASGDIRITAQDENGNRLLDLVVSEGMRCAVPSEFVDISVRNDTGATSSVVLVIGSGMVDDSQLSGTITMDKSTAISSAADVSINAATKSIVAAANSARREIMITSLSTNAAAFRVGDTNAASNRGIELLPGSTITLTTSAAVYAYNSHTAAQSLAVLEVTD